MNIPVQKGLPIPLLDNGACGSPCGRTGTGLSMLPVIWCGVVMEGAAGPSIMRTDTPRWVPACPPEVAGGGSMPLQARCIPGTTRNPGNTVPARVRRNFPLSGRACPGFFPFDGDHTKETAGTGRASSLPAGFSFLDFDTDIPSGSTSRAVRYTRYGSRSRQGRTQPGTR